VIIETSEINYQFYIMKNTVKISLAILGFLLLGSTSLWAQDGSIKGKILDKESQETVPFATVIITSSEHQVEQVQMIQGNLNWINWFQVLIK